MAFLLKIMSPDELRFTTHAGGYYRLAWFDTEDGEWGAIIGDGDIGPEPEAGVDRDVWETWAAERAAGAMHPDANVSGYCWDTRGKAQLALAAAKLAMKADRAMPEWAQTALANGWKAPKGWKP